MAKTLMSTERIRHVNAHLTPLAVLIVVPGLLVVPLPGRILIPSAMLALFSLFINYLSVYLLNGNVRLIGRIRVGLNYTVSILLLWLLYSAWPMVWVLILLMSVGVAVYQSRRDALLSATAFALMLLAIHWSYGGHTLEDWIIACVRAAMILLLNQFVNGLPEIPAGKDLPSEEVIDGETA